MKWKGNGNEGYANSIKQEIENERRDKMAKKEIEDDDFEDLNEEEDEGDEEGPEPRKPLPKASLPKIERRESPGKVRYIAVHQPQLDGAFDTGTNKLLTNDLWDMLVLIYNKLENVEKAVGS